MRAKPVVDGIEREVGSSAHVVRVDLLTESGQAIARRYGVEFSPTFLYFDRTGKLVETARFIVDGDAAVTRLRQLAQR